MRKEKNHFIVNEQEKFPIKFVFNMIFMSFLVLVLAFGLLIFRNKIFQQIKKEKLMKFHGI